MLQFDGTLIVVSHDRDFLQGLTNKVYEFRNKKIREHLGDIYDFLDYRRLKNLKELEAARQGKKQQGTKQSDNKANYERKKQLEREIRRLNNRVKATEDEIQHLEEKIARYNERLSKPDEALDFNQLSRELNGLNDNLEQKLGTWEAIHLELEQLKEELDA